MKTRTALEQADEIVGKLIGFFAPACEKIEVAGSVRRRKSEVGDLEFVAVPKFTAGGQIDLFGNAEKISQLDRRVQRAVALSLLTTVKNGERYKQFVLTGQTVGVDLFITTAEQWGYIYALRTGPSEFNQLWVTQRNKGGLLPSQYRFEDGWLRCGDEKIPTPNERQLFDLIEIGWIEPSQRNAEALKRSK